MDTAGQGEGIAQDGSNIPPMASADVASASDDDAMSDDFLSWLLVHVDDIDQKLDFDDSVFKVGIDDSDGAGEVVDDQRLSVQDEEVNVAGYSTRADIASIENAQKDAPTSSAEGSEESSVAAAISAVLSMSMTSDETGINTVGVDKQHSTRRGASSIIGDQCATAATAMELATDTRVDHPNKLGFPSHSLPVPIAGAVPETTPVQESSAPGSWPLPVGGGEAAPVERHTGAVIGGTQAGIIHPSTASSAQQLPASAIPSDPLLAMQLGARMALSGNLNLLPFPITEDGTILRVRDSASPPSQPGSQNAQAPAGFQPSLPVAVAPPMPISSSSNEMPSSRSSSVSVASAVTATGNPFVDCSPAQTHPSAVHPTCNSDASRHTVQDASSLRFSPGAAPSGTIGQGVPVATGWDTSAGLRPAKVMQSTNTETGSEILADTVGEKRRSVASRPKRRSNTSSIKDGRRRKSYSVGELEERVKQALEDNSRLKLHLVDVNKKLELMAERKKRMETEIAATLERYRSEPCRENREQLAEAVARFKDLYADYGNQRKMEIEFHLKQLEGQIVPTGTTKMSLWALNQDDSFYQDRKQGGLGNILRTELGISEEQMGRIQERRAHIRSLSAELRESLLLVRKLRASTEAKTSKFEEVMERLRSCFSPQQVATLLLWVSANRARISNLRLLRPPLPKPSSGRVETTA